MKKRPALEPIFRYSYKLEACNFTEKETLAQESSCKVLLLKRLRRPISSETFKN